MHLGVLSFSPTHVFPLWFLVVSLFLPRLSLLVWWWDHQSANVLAVPILPTIIALIVPRALILYMLYTDQGISGWFLIHAVAAVIAWYGIGGRYVQRRWSNDV